MHHSPEDEFRDATAGIDDIKELRRIYAEFLARKDAEIEELRRENDILLKTALKKRL